jgi:microcystin-dependent protein
VSLYIVKFARIGAMKRLFFVVLLALLFLGILAVPAVLADGPIIGEIIMYAGPGWPAPDGFLLCDGGLYDIADYPELYSVIGCTYGCSPPSFSLPNLRGRVIMGANYITCSSDYITSYGVPAICNEVGEYGGEVSHTLTIPEMPAHVHELYYTNNRTVYAGTLPDIGYYDLSTWHSTQPTGGDEPHNNMPPYMALNFFIAYTTTQVTPTPTLTPTATATPTSAVSYSVYTKTLSSNHQLVVPAYITFGDIFSGGLAFLIGVTLGLVALGRSTAE